MEQKTFEQLVPEVRRLIIHVASRMGLNGDDSEDIAQDVMLNLWSIRERLDVSSMKAVATVATKNRVYDNHRRKQTVPISTMMNFDVASEHHIEANVELQWLVKRMNGMPGKEYKVLHLRHVEGKSVEEIARIIGISESSVPVLVSRARKNLLKSIKEKKK